MNCKSGAMQTASAQAWGGCGSMHPSRPSSRGTAPSSTSTQVRLRVPRYPGVLTELGPAQMLPVFQHHSGSPGLGSPKGFPSGRTRCVLPPPPRPSQLRCAGILPSAVGDLPLRCAESCEPDPELPEGRQINQQIRCKWQKEIKAERSRLNQGPLTD